MTYEITINEKIFTFNNGVSIEIERNIIGINIIILSKETLKFEDELVNAFSNGNYISCTVEGKIMFKTNYDKMDTIYSSNTYSNKDGIYNKLCLFIGLG